MNLDFGGTLRRAWQITWNHKILWLFGIFSAIAGRATFNFNGGGPRFNPNNFVPNNPEAFPQIQRAFPNLDQNAIIAIGLGILCVVLIIAITLYVLHVIARGGLIGGIQLADATGQATFGQAWGAGIKHFWTVLLIGLIVAVIGILIGAASVFAAATICLTPLACIGFLLIAVLGVYTYLAQIAAVTENLSFSEALGKAWQVVQANIGPVLLLAVILIVIEVVLGFLFAIPFAIAFAPLIAAAVASGASGNGQVAAGGAIVSGLCLIVWIPVVIVLEGILETWVISTWTLAYKQLSAAPGSAVAPASPVPAAS
jgi:hypothetical protein